MRFLVDMPLSPRLAAWLREKGHDAVHASELSLHTAPDTALFDLALAESRVIVTADLDFPRLIALAHSTGPGLILLRGGNYSEAQALDCVRRVLAVVDPNEAEASLIVVDRERIRRRRLPIG